GGAVGALDEQTGRLSEMSQKVPARVPLPAAWLLRPGAHLVLQVATVAHQGADQRKQAEGGIAGPPLAAGWRADRGRRLDRRRRGQPFEQLVGNDEHLAAQRPAGGED